MRRDDIAQSAGLEFFVDHIHLSDQSGGLLTDLTSTWLVDSGLCGGSRLVGGSQRVLGSSYGLSPKVRTC